MLRGTGKKYIVQNVIQDVECGEVNMKDIKMLEMELGKLLCEYMDSKKAEEKADDHPNTHDFFNILESCEKFIKRING